MADANELTNQLRALLEQHGPAELLRAMSAGARELAEACPDGSDSLIEMAATTAQAAEALCDDGADDTEGEGDEEPEGDEPAPVPQAKASAPRTEPPPSSNEGASMKNQAIVPPRKDVTHWRARRVAEDGKKTSPLYWGVDGVEANEWPVRELSIDTLRQRWGAGRFVIYWFGRDEEGKSVPLGRGNPIHLLQLAAGAAPPPSIAGFPRAPAHHAEGPTKPSASASELLAFAALGRQGGGGGGGDLSSLLQVVAFIGEREERARTQAAERYRADLEVMLERERLASRERIAQIEATAQVQRNARAGFDVESLGEVIGRRVQEAIAPLIPDEDDGAAPTMAVPAQSSEMATVVNALKEAVAPLLAAVATKLMQDPGAFNQGAPRPAAGHHDAQ